MSVLALVLVSSGCGSLTSEAYAPSESNVARLSLDSVQDIVGKLNNLAQETTVFHSDFRGDKDALLFSDRSGRHVEIPYAELTWQLARYANGIHTYWEVSIGNVPIEEWQRWVQVGSREAAGTFIDCLAALKRQASSQPPNTTSGTHAASAPAPLAPAPAPQATVEPTRDTPPGDTFVLAVGVNEYDDARIPKLRFAEQDARSVYGFFSTSARSPAAADRVVLLVGKDATRNRILRSIREHLERKATHPQDTVILYFAGHGFSDAQDTYLAGSDTQIDSLRETGLSSGTLREYWSKIGAGRKVMIMDACHAGGIENMRGTRGVSGVKIGDEAHEGTPTSPSTTLVIAATGVNELSSEDPDLGQGVFTRVLLNGLAGEADENKDGHVTGEELGKYLVREVPAVARRFGGSQTPVVTQTSTGGPAILMTR